MMAPAAEIMANALAATELNPPMVPVFANVSAAPVREPDEIRDLLERQVTAMVRWRESVLAMGAAGVGQLVEVGAGNVLKTLTRRIDRELEALAVGTVEEIDQFLRAL
jgi:[acyl-carrier-protein] S-malonyltransferase